MKTRRDAEDAEPEQLRPTGALFVPVRSGSTGCAVRVMRTPLGEHTAVGFTSEARLAATFGPGQRWVRLGEPALRAMVAPMGVSLLTIDPVLTAPAVRPAPEQPVPAPLPARTAPTPAPAAPVPSR